MTFSFQFSVANFWTKSFCRSLHKHIYVMPPCTTHSPWQIPIIYLLHNEKQVSANDLARTGKPQPQSRKKNPRISTNNCLPFVTKIILPLISGWILDCVELIFVSPSILYTLGTHICGWPSNAHKSLWVLPKLWAAKSSSQFGLAKFMTHKPFFL